MGTGILRFSSQSDLYQDNIAGGRQIEGWRKKQEARAKLKLLSAAGEGGEEE